MSISRMPSGRYRAQVYDARTGKNVSVAKIIGGTASYPTKREAKAAREKARTALTGRQEDVTIGQWRERWTTDPLFRRPKESTNLHNAERTRPFCEAHADVPIRLLGTDQGDQLVSQWLADARRLGQVPALRAMVNDAMSAKAGRLLARNPFAGLGLEKTKGRRDIDPPDEQTVWRIIRAARDICPPSLAAWLQVAAFTGMRPGELDALRWDNVDLEHGVIHVVEQYSATSRSFTLPKNGKRRKAPITPPAREALLGVPREDVPGGFVFANTRRSHWTAPGRAYHWRAVQQRAGFYDDLYLATRHFAGWYMVNVLGLDSEDVAIALGHEDGGYLVRVLYGHRNRDDALRRVQNAYEQRANVRPLVPRSMEEAEGA